MPVRLPRVGNPRGSRGGWGIRLRVRRDVDAGGDLRVESTRVDGNKKVVRGFFEAVSERRVDDLARFLAPDVVDHNKIIHGEADEPGAAFEGLRQQLAAFDPLVVRVQELVAEDD